MFSLSRLPLFCLVVSLLLLPVGSFAGPATAPAQVAKVGSVVITQEDVDRRAQRIMPLQLSFHGKVSAEKIADIKQQALDEVVLRAYKVQYALDQELAIDSAAFESAWRQRLEKVPALSEPKNAEQVGRFKTSLYLDALAKRAEQVAVDEQIKVRDAAVKAYYRENKEKYYRPKLFKASHIFVKVEPEENAEEKAAKRKRAEKLYQRAIAGEDFYNLAYYESDDRSKYVGGSLGSFHAGQTVPEFDQAIQGMQPGEIVGPVQTMYGFHIIKLDSVEEERQLEFDEVADSIRATLEKARRDVLYQQWLDQLKTSYKVVYTDKQG
jgi:parvulin-like peptidyl-prolyl isomerase